MRLFVKFALYLVLMYLYNAHSFSSIAQAIALWDSLC